MTTGPLRAPHERTLLRIKPGYGGWVQADGDDALPVGTSLLVRFELDEELNRLIPVELHIDTIGQRLSPRDLRRVSLETIEVFANYSGEGGIRDIIETHLRTPVEMSLPLKDFPSPQSWVVGIRQGNVVAMPATVAAKASIPTPIVTGIPSPIVTDPLGLTNTVEVELSGTAASTSSATASLTSTATVTAEALARAAEGSGAAFDARVETVAPLTTPPEGRYTAEWFNQLRDAHFRAWTAWRNGGGEAPAKALANQARVSVRTVHSWLYRARHAGVEIPGQQGR